SCAETPCPPSLEGWLRSPARSGADRVASSTWPTPQTHGLSRAPYPRPPIPSPGLVSRADRWLPAPTARPHGHLSRVHLLLHLSSLHPEGLQAPPPAAPRPPRPPVAAVMFDVREAPLVRCRHWLRPLRKAPIGHKSESQASHYSVTVTSY